MGIPGMYIVRCTSFYSTLKWAIIRLVRALYRREALARLQAALDGSTRGEKYCQQCDDIWRGFLQWDGLQLAWILLGCLIHAMACRTPRHPQKISSAHTWPKMVRLTWTST